MKATYKDPELMALINSLIPKFITREDAIAEGVCVLCHTEGIEISSFTDDLSVKEYQISGMCQVCQDNIWEVIEEDSK
jgi:hypothetical protein